jgi:hypothetical protein
VSASTPTAADYLAVLGKSLDVLDYRPRRRKGLWYESVTDLLKGHGQLFESTANLPLLDLGPSAFCFANARSVAVERGWTYCEGVALDPETAFPHPHAWVVDPNGEAWEATWPVGDRTPTAMLGVPIPPPVLTAHAQTCSGAISLLFDAEPGHDYPALRHPFDGWSEDLVAELEQLRRRHCAARGGAVGPTGKRTG